MQPVFLRLVFVTLALHAALGSASEPLLQVQSAQAGDRFGAAIAGVGDVDADGIPDFLVGAYRAERAGPLSGQVRLISGRSTRELKRWQGEHAHDALGWSVAALGDLNEDGVNDFAFGAPGGTPPEGSVRVVSGRNGEALYTVVGKQPGDRFGHAITRLGDVDGDGVSDFAVGAPQADTVGQLSGRVRVVSGADGSTVRAHHGAAFDLFGQALASVADLNDDGVNELLVGAPFSDEAAFNGGSAWLFSGADGDVLMAFHGADVGDQLGHWVAAAGDVDADGHEDIALGLPGSDLGGLDAGAVQVRSGANGNVLLELTGDQAGQGWGVVAGPGDVDGDGHDDIAMGSTNAGAPDTSASAGRVRVVSGASGETLLDHTGASADAWFGYALARVGDLNADGRADVLVGAPGHDDVLSVFGSVQALVLPRADD
ncbi:MAG: hypothetical protein DHS20C15_31120 [Planctomycetota bacterium]|nr:MAG: hypothetical protein DHS20C15_31120 [Planctomycetota bacterium]